MMKSKNTKSLVHFNTLKQLIDHFDQDKMSLKAIVDKSGNDKYDITYEKFIASIQALGNTMIKMGITKGTKIGILSENRKEWPITYLAVAAIGAVIVPLDIFLGSDELLHVIRMSDMHLMFVSEQNCQKILNIKNQLPQIRHIVCFDENEEIGRSIIEKLNIQKGNLIDDTMESIIREIERMGSGNKDFLKACDLMFFEALLNIGNHLIRNQYEGYSKIEIHPDDTAAMIFTHGSFFAMLSHNALIANARGYLETAGYPNEPGERILSQLPLHHTFPAMFGILIPFLTYAAVTYTATSKAENLFHTMKITGTNTAVLVPLLLEKIYHGIFHYIKRNSFLPESLSRADQDISAFFDKLLTNENGKTIIEEAKFELGLNKIKCFTLGGAPHDEEIINGMQVLGITVLEGYGLTETSPVVSYNSFRKNKPLSVGLPIVNVQVKINEPDENGNGEILVKGPNVMNGYYKLPDISKKTLDPEGWFHTGDIGKLDSDGFLFITGRLKNIIVNKGGKNLYPEEIEQALETIPLIVKATVVKKVKKGEGEYPLAMLTLDYKALSRMEKNSQKQYSDNDIRTLIEKMIKDLPVAFYKKPKDFVIYNEEAPFVKDEQRIPKVDAPKLHALIDYNQPDLMEHKYHKMVATNDFFIKDHIVYNRHILPGVVCIEMAKAAAELSSKSNVAKMTKLVWIHPIEVNHGTKKIEIALHPKNEDMEYRIVSDGVLHAKGNIVYLADESENDNRPVDILHIKNQFSKTAKTKELYDWFKTVGLKYGVSFQPINQVFYSETQSFAALSLPCFDNDNARAGFCLHPSLMDGVLQASFFIGFNKTNRDLFLPISIEEIDIVKPLSHSCYVYAQKIDVANAQIKKSNIQVFDNDGFPVLRIKGFTAGGVAPQLFGDPELLNQKRDESNFALYYKTVWEPNALHANNPESIKDVILFDTDETTSNLLKAKHINTILVKPADKYRQLADGVYTVNPTREKDYQQLFAAIQQNQFSLSHMIHLWNYTEEPINIDNAQKLKSNLNKGIFSLLHLGKALLAKKLEGNVKILFCYQSTAMLDQPQHSAISAFARTIAKENPRIRISTINFIEKNDSKNDLIEILHQELDQMNESQSNIRYEKNLRQIQKNAALAHHKKTQSVLKKNGVYLLTGGAGGLGLIFARYLSQTYNANLILLGRTSLSEEKQKQINEINQLGGRAIYLKADVAKLASLKKAVQIAKKAFQQINGVIHAAGLVNDSLILKKSANEFTKVIGPKINGTLNLWRLTQEENVDFFVMFSSLAALIGNPGQCDYAFANNFMDDFASHRSIFNEKHNHPGNIISINWPLWKMGGMQVDPLGQKYLQHTTGIYPLETHKGIEAFEFALSCELGQIIIVDGDKPKIEKALGIVDLKKKYEQDLIRIIANLLEVNPEEIDINTHISDFGLDSMGLLQLNNTIEEMIGGPVCASIITEGPTIKSLATYLFDYKHSGNAEELLKNQSNNSETKNRYDDFLDLIQNENRFSSCFESPIAAASKRHIHKIAVIGMTGRFPSSDNVEQYWDNIRDGRDLISEVPKERFDIHRYFSPNREMPNKTYSKWGGFISGIDLFDADYFGISDEDAQSLDPQHRILLESAKQLFDNAGYDLKDMEGTNTGVFIGGGETRYIYRSKRSLSNGQMRRYIVNKIPNMMAARISDFYNLKGPAYTLDTACSSALVAIHNACQSIINCESEMALAGGIELLIDEEYFIGFSNANVLSDDGKSYVFDKKAKGFVLGEGVGLILLKSYEKAVADGDRILGIIAGSAVNNDGKTMGLTTPNMESQKEVIKKALQKANVDPDTITYLEAHGTGTLLGDPIEIKAATHVYQAYTKETNYCAVGSVKSNIGHLLRASGAASIIKVLLSLKHKEIPPTLHCSEPHPRFQFNDSPFYPIQSLQEWKPRHGVRRAAISSFGFGGTNCHLILEEFDPMEKIEYRVKRKSLPSTVFKRKRHWLPLEEQSVGHSVLDSLDSDYYNMIFSNIENGKLSYDQGIKLIALYDYELME